MQIFETHLKFLPVIRIIGKQLVEQLHTHYWSMWNESSNSCPILVWKFEISMLWPPVHPFQFTISNLICIFFTYCKEDLQKIDWMTHVCYWENKHNIETKQKNMLPSILSYKIVPFSFWKDKSKVPLFEIVILQRK